MNDLSEGLAAAICALTLLLMKNKNTKAQKRVWVNHCISLRWFTSDCVATCRSSYGIHFLGNLLRQSALIQVKVIASFRIREAGFPSQVLDRLFQQACGFIQVKSVGSAHGHMNFSVKRRPHLLPVRAEKIGNVIVLLPVGGDLRIDIPGVAIKQRHRTAVFPARAEYPLK